MDSASRLSAISFARDDPSGLSGVCSIDPSLLDDAGHGLVLWERWSRQLVLFIQLFTETGVKMRSTVGS